MHELVAIHVLVVDGAGRGGGSTPTLGNIVELGVGYGTRESRPYYIRHNRMSDETATLSRTVYETSAIKV